MDVRVFSSVRLSLSRVQFFATPWTAAGQASLSITVLGYQDIRSAGKKHSGRKISLLDFGRTLEGFLWDCREETQRGQVSPGGRVTETV